MLVLAFDPGKTNFGYCLTEFESKKFKVFENGLLRPTIGNINTKIKEETQGFKGAIIDLCKKKPDGLVAERFMTRGLHGPLIEQIAMMLGTALSKIDDILPDIKVKYVTAAVWKNETNLTLHLDQLYKITAVKPHQLDAFLMGAYFYHIYLNKDRAAFAKLLTSYPRFLKQVEKTSLEKLRNLKRARMPPSQN